MPFLWRSPDEGAFEFREDDRTETMGLVLGVLAGERNLQGAI
jgi:hypothetical protein